MTPHGWQFLLSVCRGIPSERPRRAGRVAPTEGTRILICVKEGTRQSQSLPYYGTGSKLTCELLTEISGQVLGTPLTDNKSGHTHD